MLDEIQAIAVGGAPELAQSLIDDLQASVLSSHPEVWMQAERQRLDIQISSGDWQQLIDRIDSLPETVTPEFSIWARTEQARALIELGDAVRARAQLRYLIWQEPVDLATAWFSQWRRLVIRSYLTEDRIDDAYSAMLRYQLDYGGVDTEWLLLRARVLLRGGQPTEAAALLVKVKGVQGRDLRLLARLRSEKSEAVSIMEETRRQLAVKSTSKSDVLFRWALLAEAASEAGQPETALNALEHAIALSRDHVVHKHLYDLGAGRLWQDYMTVARSIANKKQLLIGQFDAWNLEAKKLRKQKRYSARRALLAFIAVNSTGRKEDAAHATFAGAVLDAEAGTPLLQQLYIRSTQFPDPAGVPASVGQILADQAIRESNVSLASKLIGGVQAPPEGVTLLAWQLRRARILVLGGDLTRGVEALEELLALMSGLDRQQVDQINQVVFDLQTVGEHDVAFHLFTVILEKVEELAIKREILFWMADSRKEQLRHRDAAKLYLRSATLSDPAAMDPWAQSARYQMAQSLAQAGLIEDARRTYSGLLEVTADSARRAVLRREIQQLWLAVEE